MIDCVYICFLIFHVNYPRTPLQGAKRPWWVNLNNVRSHTFSICVFLICFVVFIAFIAIWNSFCLVYCVSCTEIWVLGMLGPYCLTSFSHLCPQHLEQHLAYNRHSINICWMSKWMNEWAISNCRKRFSYLVLQVMSPFKHFNLKLCYVRSNTMDIVSHPPLCFGGVSDSVNRGSEDFSVNHRWANHSDLLHLDMSH